MTEQTQTKIKEYDVIEAGLAKMTEKYATVPDASTKEGYNAIKSGVKEMRAVQIEVEEKAKELRKPIRERMELIKTESERISGKIAELMKPWKEARKVEDDRIAEEKRLKAEAEAKRLEEIQDRMSTLKSAYLSAMGKNSDDVADFIKRFQETEITEELFGDLKLEAQAVKAEAIGKLKQLHDEVKAKEEEEAKIKKEREELEALRAEQAKREAEEKEAREKEEAERKAKQEAEEERIRQEREEFEREKAEFEAKKREQEEAERKQKEEAERIKREKKEAKERAEMRKAEEEAERKRLEEIAEKRDEMRKEAIQTFLHEYRNCSEEEVNKIFDCLERDEVLYVKCDWIE